MTQQNSVLAWLKDAHAMEAGGVITLENHATAAADYPEVQAKLHEHARTTRRHADLLERSIERLGGHPSALKEALGSVAAKVAGIANLPAQDTVVKNALGDFAAENFEIACYRSLIAAAEQVDDDETAAVCRQILQDEEMMAGWLEAQIPTLTRQFLSKQTLEAGSSVPAQALDKAKETVKGLGEQGKELASNVADNVTKADGRNALLVSGALLAGAGAALLIGKALQGDAAQQPSPQRPDERSGEGAGSEGQTYTGVVNEIPAETLEDDISLPSEAQGAGETSAQPDLPSGAPELKNQTELDASGETQSQEEHSQEEIVIETLSEDAQFLLASEPRQGQTPAPELNRDTESFTAPEPLDEPQSAGEASSPVESTGVAIWLVPGPYSGLGPVNYDSAGDPLGQEVYERLAQHGHVDATHIEIVIDSGEVLLEGFVDSETTKRLVEEAVQNLEGVSGVQNLLQVRPNDGAHVN